jgi:hypothetical protein
MMETLKEAAKRLFPNEMEEYDIFLIGARWQQERSYSEEEVLDILNKRGDDLDLWYNSKSISYPKEKEWFEQFKKK